MNHSSKEIEQFRNQLVSQNTTDSVTDAHNLLHEYIYPTIVPIEREGEEGVEETKGVIHQCTFSFSKNKTKRIVLNKDTIDENMAYLKRVQSCISIYDKDIEEKRKFALLVKLAWIEDALELRALLKQGKSFDEKNFLAFLEISRTHFYNYQKIYRNWDWLEELQPKGYKHALKYIEEAQKKENNNELQVKLKRDDMAQQEKIEAQREKLQEQDQLISSQKKEISILKSQLVNKNEYILLLEEKVTKAEKKNNPKNYSEYDF